MVVLVSSVMAATPTECVSFITHRLWNIARNLVNLASKRRRNKRKTMKMTGYKPTLREERRRRNYPAHCYDRVGRLNCTKMRVLLTAFSLLASVLLCVLVRNVAARPQMPTMLDTLHSWPDWHDVGRFHLGIKWHTLHETGGPRNAPHVLSVSSP